VEQFVSTCCTVNKIIVLYIMKQWHSYVKPFWSNFHYCSIMGTTFDIILNDKQFFQTKLRFMSDIIT